MNFASVQFSYSFIYSFNKYLLTASHVSRPVYPLETCSSETEFSIPCVLSECSVLNETICIKYFFASSFQFSFLAASHPNEWLPPKEHQWKLKTSTDFVSLWSKSELNNFKISVIKHPEASVHCHLSLSSACRKDKLSYLSLLGSRWNRNEQSWSLLVEGVNVPSERQATYEMIQGFFTKK